jgi:cytosine/adenosine deaminase-related metal-dependent hydrolase
MGKAVLLRGARVAISSSRAANLDLWLSKGLISFSPVPSAQTPTLELDNCLVLPGLINAHDHLELNLFPKLGRGPYPNASAWAQDIYHPYEAPVKEHLAVPRALRLRWGGIKNLVSGVTTVAHHNALHPIFADCTFPVRVVKQYGWAHSLQFSPDWNMRLRSTPANWPFVIHAAEGTDEAASREIEILAEAGALGPSTILVHGVAIGCSHVSLLTRKRTSLVWCPTSNYFTLKRSLDAAVLNSAIPIALGTDSALTADGDLLDELRVAHRTVDAHRLYRMVTSEPARIFRLPTGFGRICHGGPADLLIVRDGGQTPAATLLEAYPELVIVRGRAQLVSAEFARCCPPSMLKSLQPLEVEGRGRYLVSEDVSSLLSETKEALRQNPRLAGKAVAA